MRASTGNAVTAIATPMNSEKLRNGTSADESREYKPNASHTPSRKGTIMPVYAIVTISRARSRTAPRCSSRPTRNM